MVKRCISELDMVYMIYATLIIDDIMRCIAHDHVRAQGNGVQLYRSASTVHIGSLAGLERAYKEFVHLESYTN